MSEAKMLPIEEALKLDSIPLVEEQINIRTDLFNSMVGNLYRPMVIDETQKITDHLEYLKKTENSVRFMDDSRREK